MGGGLGSTLDLGWNRRCFLWLRFKEGGGREVFGLRKICRLADVGIVGIDEVSDVAMAR